MAFIVFINSLLDLLPKDSTFGYADDLGIIIPYGKNKNKKDQSGNDNHEMNTKNEKVAQKCLDICTEWSNRTGLKVNTEKCYLIGIGLRKKPNVDFKLVNEIVSTPDNNEVTVLGLNFLRGKKDFLYSAKKAAKQSGRLVFKRLKTLYRQTKFRHIKKLYHIYFASKALYGSKIMEDCTWNEGNYTKEDRWTKKLDSLFKGMFIGKLPKKNDLEKGKKKKYTSNPDIDGIPFLPSQLCLIKTLILAFKIIGGHLEDSDLTLKQMTKSKENNTQAFTRSQSLTLLNRELSEETSKTLIRRQNNIIREIMNSEKYGTIQHMKPVKQKHMIKQYVSEMKSEENEIRIKISKKIFRPSIEDRARAVRWKVVRLVNNKITL